jgi:hypothetical protein
MGWVRKASVAHRSYCLPRGIVCQWLGPAREAVASCRAGGGGTFLVAEALVGFLGTSPSPSSNRTLAARRGAWGHKVGYPVAARVLASARHGPGAGPLAAGWPEADGSPGQPARDGKRPWTARRGCAECLPRGPGDSARGRGKNALGVFCAARYRLQILQRLLGSGARRRSPQGRCKLCGRTGLPSPGWPVLPGFRCALARGLQCVAGPRGIARAAEGNRPWRRRKDPRRETQAWKLGGGRSRAGWWQERH